MLVIFKIVFWFLKNGPLFIYSYSNRRNRKLNYLGLLNLVHIHIIFLYCPTLDRHFTEYFYFWQFLIFFLLWLLWFSLTKLKIWSFSRYIQNWFLYKYFLKIANVWYNVCWWIFRHIKTWRGFWPLKEAEFC